MVCKSSRKKPGTHKYTFSYSGVAERLVLEMRMLRREMKWQRAAAPAAR